MSNYDGNAKYTLQRSGDPDAPVAKITTEAAFDLEVIEDGDMAGSKGLIGSAITATGYAKDGDRVGLVTGLPAYLSPLSLGDGAELTLEVFGL